MSFFQKAKDMIKDGQELVNKQKENIGNVVGKVQETKQSFTKEKESEKEQQKLAAKLEKEKQKQVKKNQKEELKEQKKAQKMSKKEEQKKAIDFYFDDVLEENNFNTDKKVEVQLGFVKGKLALLIDDTNKRVAVATNEKLVRNVIFLNYSDILNFELNEDGESILQGKMLSTVAGGAVFGPIGALAGAAGKRKSKKTCNYMAVRILVNNLQSPEIVIPLIEKETPKNSVLYKNSRTKAQELTATLTYIQNNV